VTLVLVRSANNKKYLDQQHCEKPSSPVHILIFVMIWFSINSGVCASVQEATPPPPLIFFPSTAVLRIRIRIIVEDPDTDPSFGCIGSGSGTISYSNEHNKINWKGKFNKEYLLYRSCWTY
jgi:hypothetical protein